ncbi:MAG: molecular chaperone DnaK, partial [Planctomycetes bacterium]|nr:molecular chaperone DnaK [Planctomycetota bacterium]
PPIRTVLRTRGKKQAASLPVALHARLTEIGTLELWCSEVGSQRSWRLQFDIRSATQTDIEARQTEGESEGVVDEPTWLACRQVIADTFGEGGQNKPAGLMKQLSTELDMDRWDWPMPLLRRIWETLMEFREGRRRSPAHEKRWLNLLGFALRPGFGVAVDDWRVAETWRTVQGRLVHGAAESRTESWILWRRISGGMSAGQQQAIADPLLSAVRGLHRRLTTGKGAGDFSFTPQESIEMWRLLGALELLDVSLKAELGDALVEMLDKRSMQPARPAIVWALGRIGTRMPVYGPLNRVVATDVTTRWLSALMRVRQPDDADKLAVLQLARRTGDRYRDLGDKLRAEVIDWMQSHAAPPRFSELVSTVGTLDREEQGRVFGESLPKGLQIR